MKIYHHNVIDLHILFYLVVDAALKTDNLDTAIDLTDDDEYYKNSAVSSRNVITVLVTDQWREE